MLETGCRKRGEDRTIKGESKGEKFYKACVRHRFVFLIKINCNGFKYKCEKKKLNEKRYSFLCIYKMGIMSQPHFTEYSITFLLRKVFSVENF